MGFVIISFWHIRQHYGQVPVCPLKGASLTLKAMDEKHTSLFVGQWAAPFLLLGIYNKPVKLEGHAKRMMVRNSMQQRAVGAKFHPKAIGHGGSEKG